MTARQPGVGDLVRLTGGPQASRGLTGTVAAADGGRVIVEVDGHGPLSFAPGELAVEAAADDDPLSRAVLRARARCSPGARAADLRAAAEQALEPVRELHVPTRTRWGRMCAECGLVYPCRTARAVYTTAELQQLPTRTFDY